MLVIDRFHQAIRDDMDAHEIESLSMLSRGFLELKDANPELVYSVVLDILCGINECVTCHYKCGEKLNFLILSNPAIRQHVQTSRSLFPHKRIIRKSEMTAQGLVVTEVQEEVTGLPSSSDSGHSTTPASVKSDDSTTPSRKSPIAELLYMRWLEGLKIKWPSFT